VIGVGRPGEKALDRPGSLARCLVCQKGPDFGRDGYASTKRQVQSSYEGGVIGTWGCEDTGSLQFFEDETVNFGRQGTCGHPRPLGGVGPARARSKTASSKHATNPDRRCIAAPSSRNLNSTLQSKFGHIVTQEPSAPSLICLSVGWVLTRPTGHVLLRTGLKPSYCGLFTACLHPQSSPASASERCIHPLRLSR